MYGSKAFGAMVLELNASDERGIDVVRNQARARGPRARATLRETPETSVVGKRSGPARERARETRTG